PDLAGITAPRSRVATPVLLAAADGMLQTAEHHRDALATVLPSDFLEELQAAIQDVKNAVESGRASRAKRCAATATVVAATARGRQAVRVLDGLVLGALDGDVRLEREWKARRRILVSTPPESAAIVHEPDDEPPTPASSLSGERSLPRHLS